MVRTPLLAMIFACAVNISLDLLFVASFDMGVEGAAIATVIAQGCSALICLRAPLAQRPSSASAGRICARTSTPLPAT